MRIEPTRVESSFRSSFLLTKENSLALTLQSCALGDAIVLHCKGRIVFREEVVKLSQVVGESIETSDVVILDLKGVSGD